MGNKTRFEVAPSEKAAQSYLRMACQKILWFHHGSGVIATQPEGALTAGLP